MTNDLKRIVPSSIPALFHKYGVTPRHGVWLKRGGTGVPPCGCLVGIIAVDLIGDTTTAILTMIGFDDDGAFESMVANTVRCRGGYDGRYVLGLSSGWDSIHDTLPDDAKIADWKRCWGWPDERLAGYVDGIAARLECEKAGLMEPYPG